MDQKEKWYNSDLPEYLQKSVSAAKAEAKTKAAAEAKEAAEKTAVVEVAVDTAAKPANQTVVKANAKKNAMMYGGRPLLVLDAAKFVAGGPLFACA